MRAILSCCVLVPAAVLRKWGRVSPPQAAPCSTTPECVQPAEPSAHTVRPAPATPNCQTTLSPGGTLAPSLLPLSPCCSLQRPFVFRPPTRVTVVGSFGLRCSVAPALAADLAVLMPAACFDSKDQLNHRWAGLRFFVLYTFYYA